jgi:hypothetical protein
MSTATSGLHPATAAGQTDSYIPKGRIGRLDLGRGCYTVAEVFSLAAQDLAARGLAGQAAAAIRARVTTVRAFLTERYGCPLGERVLDPFQPFA